MLLQYQDAKTDTAIYQMMQILDFYSAKILQYFNYTSGHGKRQDDIYKGIQQIPMWLKPFVSQQLANQ